MWTKSRPQLLSITLAALLIPTALPAVDCDGPEADLWDWEVVPSQILSVPRDDCGGGGPLTDPPTESYYGDFLPEELDSILYGFDLEVSDLNLFFGEELAVFQLLGDQPQPMVTVLIAGTAAEPQYKVQWRDDNSVPGSNFLAIPVVEGEIMTVAWILGTETEYGSLELSIDGQSVLKVEVDNHEKEPTEARIGIVDATRHPGAGAGELRFYPRAKHWDF